MKALSDRHASVRTLVRQGTAPERLERLREPGVDIACVDMSNPREVAQACEGSSCLVSALAGLRDAIVALI